MYIILLFPFLLSLAYRLGDYLIANGAPTFRAAQVVPAPSSTKTKSPLLWIVIGAIVGIILLVALIAIIVIIVRGRRHLTNQKKKRGRRRKNKGKQEEATRQKEEEAGSKKE